MTVASLQSWFRMTGAWAIGIGLLGVAGCQPSSRPATSPDSEASSQGNAAAESSNAPNGSATNTPIHSSSQTGVTTNPGDGSWWSEPYPAVFDKATLTNTPSRVSVKGNRFVDEAGNTMVFHGVNISDPDKLARDGRWSKRHFEVIASWGADVVRVPVHPAAWRGRGKDAYFELLDDAVRWSNELNLYVVIDWHSIGNLRTGMFQHPIYETTLQETNQFWRAVSHRYAGVSTVAFYELFNEPTLYNGTLGSMTWNEWRGMVEEMISIIQANDPKVIPLVGGLNWAYDLRDVAKQPINRTGIGYVSHPYPEKTTQPFEKNWDRDFGSVSKRYPLFATEIGYMAHDAPGAHVPVKSDGSYGQLITDYLDKKGASWTAWCFEPDWPPQLIADWNYTPTNAGNHFRAVMLEKAKVKAATQQLAAEATAAKQAAEDKKAADKQAAEAKRAADKQAAEAKKAAAKQAAEAKQAAANAKSGQTEVAPTSGAVKPVAAKTEPKTQATPVATPTNTPTATPSAAPTSVAVGGGANPSPPAPTTSPVAKPPAAKPPNAIAPSAPKPSASGSSSASTKPPQPVTAAVRAQKPADGPASPSSAPNTPPATKSDQKPAAPKASTPTAPAGSAP
jgi:endoglucanase